VASSAWPRAICAADVFAEAVDGLGELAGACRGRPVENGEADRDGGERGAGV